MLEIPLHAGHGHPNLVWILVPSFLSFMAGLGLGATSDRFREWIGSQDATSAE
ncbi:hypothetical protein ACLI4Z_13785 [Natrialbaceae archaeon A-arb3/5]